MQRELFFEEDMVDHGVFINKLLFTKHNAGS